MSNEAKVEELEVIVLDENISNYGIQKTQANDMIGNLPQLQKERDVLVVEYNKILKMDINDADTLKKAKRTRLDIRNNRTKGINTWHSTNKEVSLRLGQFLDAVKNREIAINQGMEDKLLEIEKHAELKEAKRISDLTIAREKELESFELEIIPPNLGSIDDATWEAMKLGYKASQDAKIKAEKEEVERIEKERIEAEKIEAERFRIEQLEKERRFKTSRLVEYIEDYDTTVFAELSEVEFEKTCKSAIDARSKHEAEQEAIRIENERLKKEAIEREAEAEKQRIEQKKIDDKKEADRIKKEKSENEERARLQKIEDDKKEELEKQAREAKEKADKLEAEAEKKRIAEIKANNDRIIQIEADKQAELNKGDSDKVIDLIADLEALKTKYSFDSAKSKKMMVGVDDLLTKVVGFINK